MDASVPDATVSDAAVADASLGDATAAGVLKLSEGTVALHDYRGVISGPSGGDTCKYATPTTFSKQLYDLGIRSIRNNDYYDDTLDTDLMFNCSGKVYGSNAACNNEYPCWKGCTLKYPAGCGAMQFAAGASGGVTSDGRFDSIVNAGFEPFLRVGGEYSLTPALLATATTARAARGPQTDEEEANWIEAAKCTASHYVGVKSFPYLNIMTETTSHFWSRDWPSFNKFWRRAFAELKATFGTQFKIGGPGIWGAPWIVNLLDAHEKTASCAASTSLPARDFLKTLADNGDKPDWLGIHIFAPGAADFSRVITAYKALLTKSGPCFGAGKTLESPWAADYFSKAELIVDAFMPGKTDLSSGKEVANADRYFDNKEGGALNASNFIVFQNEGVERAYQYRAGEQGPKGPNEGITRCDANATPKPRANVYRFWNRMMEAGAKQGTLLAPAPNTSLYVLYASAGTKRFVLLANPSATAVTFSPQWQTSPATILAHAERSLYTIDDTNDGTKAASITADSVTVAPQTTSLLTVE